MASRKQLAQLDILAVINLNDPGSGFVGFSAKMDGLYQKIGATADTRLLTAVDIGVNVAAYNHSHPYLLLSGGVMSNTNVVTNLNADLLDGQHGSYYATAVHNHSGVYQPLDADLTAIAALAGTSGLLKKTAADTWALDTTTYVSGTPWTGMGYVTGTPWTSMGYLTSQTSHADVLVDGDFTSQGIMLRGATSGVYSILSDNSANWNTAFGWGNHAGLYSLTSHTHSGYQSTLSGTGLVKSTAGVISYDTNTYVTGTPWTGMGYLTGITKPMVEAVLTGVISTHSHDLSGYSLTSHNHLGVYQPLDADLTAIAALAGTSGLLKKTAADTWTLDTTTYVSGTPWTGMGYVTGTPWTSMGYLTSQTSHADVLVDGDFTSQGIMLRGASSGVYTILSDNSSNWNTAFGWGNHAGLYSLTSHTHSGYQATLSGTGLVKSTAGVISYDTNTYVTGTPWTGMGYLTSLPSHSIGTHSDTFLSGLSNGQILLYWSGYWSNKTLVDSGIQAAITTGTNQQYLRGDLTLGTFSHTIQSHSDVYIPVSLDGSYSGRSLYWTGSNWGIGTPWTSAGYLTSITKAQVEAVLTGTISSHTHSYEPTLGNPGTSGYVLSSTSAGVRSWVAMGGVYTLPLAGSAVRGGIQINGTTPAAGCLPVSLYNESPYVSMTKAVVEYVLTGLITTHTHSYAPINGSSSNAFATAALTVTGTINASSTITGSEVYRGSSRALKNNITDFNIDALGFLCNVDIKRYNLKSNGSFGIGFIAEDTHPWLSGIDQKSHNFGNHLGLLTKAIQQEDEKVVAMKMEIMDLKARIKELEIARSNGR